MLNKTGWQPVNSCPLGGIHFPFCLQQRARYDRPIWDGPTGQLEKKLWGFELTELESSNGKGKGSRLDFESTPNSLVRNIECMSTCISESPMWVVLFVNIHMKFADRINMIISVSVRFSLPKTLQGIQYQFVEATIYQLTLFPESRKISKHRIEPSSRCFNTDRHVWLNGSTATRSLRKRTLQTAEQDEEHSSLGQCSILYCVYQWIY